MPYVVVVVNFCKSMSLVIRAQLSETFFLLEGRNHIFSLQFNSLKFLHQMTTAHHSSNFKKLKVDNSSNMSTFIDILI